MLNAALADVAEVLTHRFVRANEDDAVFDAFANDHFTPKATVDEYSR